MCLSDISKKMIASKDIVVKKQLVKCAIVKPSKKLHGKPFTATILNYNKKYFVSGHISIDDNRIFLCSDHEKADGLCIKDKHGHTFSWLLNSTVLHLTIDGKKCPTGYKTPYLQVNISLGETYTSPIIVTEYQNIDVGLHSYLMEAVVNCAENGIIVKCIIPKGSEYYVGTFDGQRSLVSNCLRYTHEILNQ